MGKGRVALWVCGVALAGCEARRADPRYKVQPETVEDTVAGLTWQRATSDNMALAKAEEYCAGLTLDGYGGFRVPMLGELLSVTRKVRVYDALRGKPAIDRVAFPNTPNVRFWALPPPDVPRNSLKAYSVDFADGAHDNLSTPGDGHRVRCVR